MEVAFVRVMVRVRCGCLRKFGTSRLCGPHWMMGTYQPITAKKGEITTGAVKVLERWLFTVKCCGERGVNVHPSGGRPQRMWSFVEISGLRGIPLISVFRVSR